MSPRTMNSDLHYDFPVSTHLVFANHQEVEKKKAIVRDDTGQVIGIVSEKYKLLEHKTVVEKLREALSEIDAGYLEQISLSSNGASMFLKYTLPSVQVEIKKGDKVALQLIVKNSYDGSGSLRIMVGAFRLVCSNGMIIGRKFLELSRRHVGTDLGIDDFKDKIASATKMFHAELPFIQAMSQETYVKVFGVGYEESMFSTEHVRLPDYLLEEAKKSFIESRGATVWDFYNALTWAITHRMRRDTLASKIHYGKVAWKAAHQLMVGVRAE